MKPQDYLNKKGIEIFNKLIEHIGNRTMPADSFQLSNLANAIEVHARASQEISDNPVQITANGYSQITGWFTVWKETNKTIETLSAKFGLTPADREKIKAFAESKPKRKSKIDQLRNK